MTVPSEISHSGPYNGNGVTTVFDYEFRIVSENHLTVIKTVGGVQTTLAIDADYIVSDVGGLEGGQVVLTVAPAIGETITILRNVPFTQDTDLENQGAYFAETIENSLDLAVMRDQQLQEQVDRALLMPPGSVALPFPTPNDGKLIGWNGNQLENKALLNTGLAAPATQLQAEAGTNNDTFMTPLRTKQAIDAFAEGDKGDITVSDGVWAINGNAITYAKMQDVSAASRLLGRGSAGGAGDPQEITVGAGLSMSGATLSANVTATYVRLNFVDATSIRLDRYNGQHLWIGGRNEVVPSAGVALSNAGLAANTWYYIYAWMNDGVMTLEASTTSPLFYADYGIRIKNTGGGEVYTLVGRARTNGASQFFNDFTAYGVQSIFNPVRRLRFEQVFFGPRPGDGYTVPDGTGGGTNFVFLTGTTANTLPYWAVSMGLAKITYANFRVIAAANNPANKIRLVHSEDGPVNITEIGRWTANGSGNPENFATSVTAALQNLQETHIGPLKSLGIQVTKLNATTLTVYKAALEIELDLDPWVP
jgi:hypothetical protein